ncbi:uncharacterized protein LOC133902972 [Phragmites australis]|uniref:uncharacterized protein LOC133902972 n=1 Tax=Phragmites australis TaxID=29695 RepID=UPI002D776F97|nr:uncharacterized protein LOC133902972 [Phragmites australis]
MAAAPNPVSLGNPRSRGDRILALLAPYLSFADHLTLRIVCRGWRRSCRLLGRAPPPFPWLMLPPPSPTRGPPAPGAAQRRVFYDIPRGRTYAYAVPALHRYVASRGGWLVLAAVHPPRRLVLMNPITGARGVIAWPFGEKVIDGFHAVLTSSPADPACFLAVATDRLVAYCRPGRGGGWVTLRAPGFRYDTAGSDVLAVGATVYLVDERRKLWRADLAAAEPKVERRDTAFALPQGERRLHYLVKSLGHVHLVVSDEHHKRMALFRLDWHARMWVPTPADGLGDRVLLLGRGCSAAVPSWAASGRAPGTVLIARQAWGFLHVGSDARGGEQPWFWTESRLNAGLDDQMALKKTVPHRPGVFTAGDSFWFFPGIDSTECA